MDLDTEGSRKQREEGQVEERKAFFPLEKGNRSSEPEVELSFQLAKRML